MTIYTHQCSCGKTYEDDDPDVYFCPVCVKKRKDIAKEIDKKLVGRIPKNIKSDLQVYDEVRRATGGRFPNARDLGFF